MKQLERSRRCADRRLVKKKKANKLRFEIRYLRLKVDKLKQQIKKRLIKPMITNMNHNPHPPNNVSMTNYDINLHSMFATYHYGTGSLDVVKMLSMLG